MRNRYSEFFKLQVVQAYLHGDSSITEMARQSGLDYSMVRRWIAQYRHQGPEGLRRTRHHYSTAFKREVLERMWRDGLSIRQTEALFDIRLSGAIGRWEQQYHSGGLEAFASPRRGRPPMTKSPPPPPGKGQPDERSRDELLEELAYLRAENAYLKKLDALLREQKAVQRNKRR